MLPLIIFIVSFFHLLTCAKSFLLSSHKCHRCKKLQELSGDRNLFALQVIPNEVTDEELDLKVKMAKHHLLSVAAAIMNVPSEIFTTPPMLDPYPPKGSDQITRRHKVTELMDEGWEHPSDGFSIPQEEEKSINTLMSSNETGRLPSTYGEITQLGARQLFSYMKLRSDISTLQSSNKKMESINDETKISFVDLGCGTGRLLVQAYLELPTVCNFLGIELSKARYSMAAYAWKELQDNATVVRHEGDAVNATLQFLHGDLFDLDVSAATHIYVASLCFTDNMMIRLGDKLIQEGKSLQCIATLKPFPLQCNNALGGEPIRQYVEMTWTKSRGQGCTVYFYYL